MIFRGLAVPGFPGISNKEDLVAIWSSKDNKRFQNYKATFSILDVSQVKREWLNNLSNDRVKAIPNNSEIQKTIDRIITRLKAIKDLVRDANN